MNVRTILRGMDAATHDERMKRMVALGREARSTPAVAAAIATLAEGGFFEKLLALQSIHGSHDGRAAARATYDTSRTIRGRAIRLVALYADDATVADVLRNARPSLRLPLVRHLRARGRVVPVDTFLDDLAARADRDLPALLPFGSSSSIARHAELALERSTPAHWSRLARFHPNETLALLNARLDRPEAGHTSMRAESNAVLHVVSRTRPDDAVRLATRLATRWPIGALRLTWLERTRPAAVGTLLANSDDQAGPTGSRTRPDRLDDAKLHTLLRRRPELLGQPERWLQRLPPDRRGPAVDAAGPAWRDAAGALQVEVLACLPRDRRWAEGRRHLSLPALATEPALRIRYASLLPWEEARSLCTPLLGHPEPALRSAGIAALLGTIRYERGRLADGLALIHARRHEQDPVRLAMLTALAALPTLAFHEATLDATGQVLRQALDAADLSEATAAAAQKLVVRLVPRHPSWAAAWLETLVREQGTIALDDLGARWGDAHALPLGEVMAPMLKLWSRRERDGQIAVLARALGARLRRFETLHPHLERIARESRDWASTWALQLLKRHATDRFAALVPCLLRDDRSWGTQPEVYSYLHRRRQDLLGPFLGRTAWPGRFSTGRTRFVLPFVAGFQRWTPAQQKAFADTLVELTATPDERDTPTVLHAVRQLSALPAFGSDRVIALANDPTRLAIREGALRTLPSLDSDAGVATLIEALADERARVATYSLRQALRDSRPADALRLLSGAPLKSLTVAKEIVRLVGEIPGDEAFTLLRSLADGFGRTAAGEKRPVHRDLRVALLRSYWGHLDRSDAWEEIDKAVDEADPALVSGLVRLPSDGRSTRERERLATILLRLLSHRDPAIRCGVLVRLVSDPISDCDGRLLTAALERLRSVVPVERAAAARAVAFAGNAGSAGQIAAALGTLSGDRRAQKALIDALVAWAPIDRARLVPVARAGIAALASDELTAPLRATLVIAALPGTERIEALETLARSGSITADVLRAVEDAVVALAARPTAVEIDDLVERLGVSPDEWLRRVAFAGFVARSEARQGPGWSRERVRRLQAFRSDPSRLVAAAAQFTLPLAELEPVTSKAGREPE